MVYNVIGQFCYGNARQRITLYPNAKKKINKTACPCVVRPSGQVTRLAHPDPSRSFVQGQHVTEQRWVGMPRLFHNAASSHIIYEQQRTCSKSHLHRKAFLRATSGSGSRKQKSWVAAEGALTHREAKCIVQVQGAAAGRASVAGTGKTRSWTVARGGPRSSLGPINGRPFRFLWTVWHWSPFFIRLGNSSPWQAFSIKSLPLYNKHVTKLPSTVI